MQTLEINGMYFHAFHGCLPEEEKLGGRYRVDVSIVADYNVAADSDELDKTADYERVFQIVEAEMGKPSKLIEAAAKRACLSLSVEYPWAKRINVILTKYDPPVKGRRIAEAKINWEWVA